RREGEPNKKLEAEGERRSRERERERRDPSPRDSYPPPYARCFTQPPLFLSSFLSLSLSLSLKSTLFHLFAVAPVKVELLGEGDGGIIVGDGAKGLRLARPQRDPVVDVEDSGGATGREDERGGGDTVGLGVDLA